ncbi:tRNA lysidine(34) synthetase TilS [Pseudonocardia spinosispora]|uniref:tRNA lysidine(34) synthetase TilS n=1 Tax=Pseudonocardia spinosispora TaxID=103441 RepID=UPI0004043874|nr:tRNA lysidine(34) synthetase TilS [Pseudonocardia spinosispora]
MAGPSEEVALLRLAVRRGLAGAGVPPGTPLLVACSGGADSMALAAAVAVLRDRWPVHAAVVDHGLQDGSARQAAETAELLTGMGLVAEVHQVTVAGGGGTEAAARRARYAALRAARPSENSPVLLGHTLDDQAETVLLGLGRGSGARSIAGMRGWDPPWLRPLLAVRRATTRAVCVQLGLPIWDDPHNLEPRFTRVRLRTEVLPLLEDVLAGGVAEALARTAVQLREDGDALDGLAAAAYRDALVEGELEVKTLADYPASVRRRALRIWLLAQGVSDLTDAALRRADDLIGNWRGQGEITLPRGWVLYRRHGRLVLGNRLGGATVPPRVNEA